MKLLFPFYFFIFAFISVKQNYSGNEVLTKDSNEPSIICPCHPQYAGTDKFTCSAAPAESVVIGCNDGGSVDCADLCYLWAPALGLGNGDLGKKNPTVSPTTTTTYTLTVTNTKTGDVVSTTSMTVYVVHLELILYTPCVIATNNTTPASLTLGAQTFVNLDNDDQDTYFDNDALESSTNGVNPAGGGGDDELVLSLITKSVPPVCTKSVPLCRSKLGNVVKLC